MEPGVGPGRAFLAVVALLSLSCFVFFLATLATPLLVSVAADADVATDVVDLRVDTCDVVDDGE